MKKFVIVGIIALIILSIGTLLIISHNKSLAAPTEEAGSTLAIMVYDESLSDYVKQDTVPKGNYKLNRTKTHCVGGGKISSYDYKTGTINYSLGADQCYVYFDPVDSITKASVINSETYLTDGILSLVGGLYDDEYVESQWAVVNETFVDESSGETVSTGYRYEGKNPDNFVCFDSTCKDGFFRIIGVFDESSHGIAGTNLVKVVSGSSIGNFLWNSRTYGTNLHDWPNSTLFTYLNNEYYKQITTASSMIESATWYLGGVSWEYTSNAPADYYAAERGESVTSGNSVSTLANIGMIYPTDYIYAVLESLCPRSILPSDRVETEGYFKGPCNQNNWLFHGESWLLTHFKTSGNKSVLYIQSGGYVSYTTGSDSYRLAVYPSFYLKSTVKVLSGSGTKSDPYILGI